MPKGQSHKAFYGVIYYSLFFEIYIYGQCYKKNFNVITLLLL
jgi:hypothetical protein